MSRDKKIRMGRRSALPAVSVAAVTVSLMIGIAAPRGVAAGPEAAHAEYLPSISDLMIATIQPRHERLWQAGQDKNWEFAGYELGNLHGAFNRIGIAHSTVHDLPFPEMIESVTKPPLDELNRAIQSKDGIAFVNAYADLTSACNSCHQALNHGVVVIRVPNGKSTSDLGVTDASRD